MWVFGGRDDDNNKLNDLWKFDIASSVWQEVKPADGVYPLERSGHSCDVFEGQYLIIFGGIYEITKELNDLHMFDFSKKKWVTVFEESNSPIRAYKEGSPAFTNDNTDPLSLTAGLHAPNGSPATQKKSFASSPLKKKPELFSSPLKNGAYISRNSNNLHTAAT
jgi:Galactose oxidase, central domain